MLDRIQNLSLVVAIFDLPGPLSLPSLALVGCYWLAIVVLEAVVLVSRHTGCPIGRLRWIPALKLPSLVGCQMVDFLWRGGNAV